MGRVIKMKEQPHYSNLLTKDFFEEYYIDKKMSYPKIRSMLTEMGYNIHVGTLYKYAKKIGIGRTFSEARRNVDPDSLDYNTIYVRDDIIEFVDGFLLGDGSINSRINRTESVGRFRCGVEHEDFCQYLMVPFLDLGAKVIKTNSQNMKQGFMFSGSTRYHPDIYQQYLRWYPENKNGDRVKQPPEDVKITSESVMRWYLGDGCVVARNNTVTLRLSTDGFAMEKVEMLVGKLQQIGIKCHRNNENRIRVDAKGIPAFFDLIGRISPIECYKYKFDRIPLWRFESKRMKEVSDRLEVNYHILCSLVKKGKVPCFRLSKKGRPRFLPEHIKIVQKLKESGELY